MRPANGVKREIPSGKPRILPRIRHGQHVEGIKVPPTGVAAKSMPERRRWLTRIPIQPPGHPVRVHLLAPDPPRARLPQNPHLYLADLIGCQGRIELICFPFPIGYDGVEVAHMPPVVHGRYLLIRSVKSEANLRRTPGGNRDLVPPTRLGAMLIWVHRVGPSDHMVIDAILRVIGNWR